MYALVRNGSVVRTFGSIPDTMEDYSAFHLMPQAEREALGFLPVIDNRTPLTTQWHYYTNDVYTFSGNQVLWTATVNEHPKTPDEQDAETAKAYPKLQALRNMTPAQVQAWVDANVNTLAEAKEALDRVEAHRWPHREIARYVRETYKVPNWWNQMVTVGYERIKGLRAKGQRRDGGYAVTRSKTVHMPVSRLYRAINDGRTRALWLPDARFTVRTRIKDRSMRLTWSDRSLVLVYFQAKGPDRSLISIEQANLPDAATAATRRSYWGERLEALAATGNGRKGKSEE